MQLSFAHCSLEAEQESVIEACWIVDAVLVKDQGVSEGADLQQTLSVGIVPREPGDLQAHDDAGAAHTDVADQVLKALAPGSRCTGLALITVDDDDLLVAPRTSSSSSTTQYRVWIQRQ